MMRPALLAACFAFSAGAAAQPYNERPEVRDFIRQLVERHGFAENELSELFSQAQRTKPILEAIQSPAERRSWVDYRALFVNERRIEGGTEFWRAHREALERAEREYGVPPQYVAAIIGIETLYGRNTGRWRVLDALTTLAFDYPPRAPFFRDELENYLLLTRETHLDVLSVRGSYAGAIGIPQFMPGSLRRYAVDFDGDGAIDLERNVADAIGSVGSFLKQHGWQAGARVQLKARVRGEAWRAFADGSLEPRHGLAELQRAGVEIIDAPPGLDASLVALIDLGSERRLGLRNFYVLTRYNRSALYASAVADLGEALKERMAQSAGK